MSDRDSKIEENIANGLPPSAGLGRPKGSPNKSTLAAREAFMLAFDKVGAVEKLAEWARENRSLFYKLYARLIPVQVTGADGGPLIPQRLEVTFPQLPKSEPIDISPTQNGQKVLSSDRIAIPSEPGGDDHGEG